MAITINHQTNDISATSGDMTIDGSSLVTQGDTSTASMSFVIDEDNMASNSATKVPTQQSVKAYTDASVSALVDSAPSTLDTLNELAAALGDDANFSTTVTNSIAAKMPLAGGTFTGDVTFGDSVKAKFGSSNDLNIYHDASNSVIQDSGTGDLIIGADNNIVLADAALAEVKALFTTNGAASLYYDNSSKLATTTNGISISGSATLDNDGTLLDFSRVGDAVAGQLKYVDADTGFHFGTTTNHDWYGISNDTKRFKVDNAGIVTFYNGIDVGNNDTGSAGLINVYGGSTGEGGEIKIYPSAANDTTIDSFSIDIAGDSLRIFDSNGDMHSQFVPNGAAELYHNGSKKFETSAVGSKTDQLFGISDADTGIALGANGSDIMQFYTGNNERMRLTSAGDLLLGASQTASSGLGVITGKNITFTENSTTTSYVNIFRQSSSGAGILANGYRYSGTSNKMQSSLSSSWAKSAVGVYSGYIGFFTDAASADTIGTDLTPSERMRLTTTGLGVGESNPQVKLHVKGGTNQNVMIVDATGTSANYIFDVRDDGDSKFRVEPNGTVKVHGSGDSRLVIKTGNNTGWSELFFGDTDAENKGQVSYNHSNDYMAFVTNGAERMRLEHDSDLHVDGNVIAYSTTISDERLKEDIKPIEGALNKVGQLSGYTFTYKADGKQSAGVIAQEVEKVLPSAVSEKALPLKADDGIEYKTVEYDQLVGLLIESVKELKAEIEELKNGSSS